MPNQTTRTGKPTPVVPGSHADREGLDGLEYVTGSTPEGTVSDRLDGAEDADGEPIATVAGPDVPSPEVDDDGETDAPALTLPDVDDQGRDGEPDQDWLGQPDTESARRAPRRTRG